MSMYKRPPLRVRDLDTKAPKHNKAPVGSFIDKLMNPLPNVFYEQVKKPIYQKEAYLVLLKKNHEERGIEWVEPEIPDYEPPQLVEKPKEPELTIIDKVYLNLRILKSGIVRVKLNTSFYSLYEKYYSKNKLPPIKMIIQAYKSHGFDDNFLECIKTRHEKRFAFGKRVSKALDAIFNKEPAKKTKKKKEEEPKLETEEENNDEEQDQEDDGPEEDEALDVEIDEDLEEQQEEEYFSDGGD